MVINILELKTLKGIIYQITNNINQKYYFGQSLETFYERYSSGEWWKWTKNSHLKHAAKKYGSENFFIEILHHNKNIDELNELETFYIKKYKSDDRRFGYNKKSGGSKGRHNDETKKLISQKNLISFDEFLQRSKSQHGDNFEYFKDSFKGSRLKVKMLHKKCGRVFEQIAFTHMCGMGCRKCNKTREKDTFESVVGKFKTFDKGEWEYYNDNYVDCNSNIRMIHKKCGKEVFRNRRYHKKLQRCIFCEPKHADHSARILPFEDFEIKAKSCHNDNYTYDKSTFVKSSIKTKIIHVKCGREFWQTPNSHLFGHGCPTCGHLISPTLKSKKVLQISPSDGSIIKEYPSIREAARQLEIDNQGIRRVCKGERKLAAGYSWKYA